MKYENPVVTVDNVDEITEYSLSLQDKIDVMTKERQYLSKFLVDFLMSTGVDTHVTDSSRTLKLVPVLSRSLSDIHDKERETLHKWVIEKHPELITINHARLQKLLADGVICPISMGSDGYSIRITRKVTGQKVRKITDIEVKSEGHEIEEVPKTITPQQTQEEKILQKKLTHEERLARLVGMQEMWDRGETFRAIAKKYGMNAGYVKKMLASYIRHRMNEMRKAISIKRTEGDIIASIDI